MSFDFMKASHGSVAKYLIQVYLISSGYDAVEHKSHDTERSKSDKESDDLGNGICSVFYQLLGGVFGLYWFSIMKLLPGGITG